MYLLDSDMGKGVGLTYPIELAGYEIDSAHVVFQDLDTVVHYGYQVTGVNPDAVLYDSSANIFNLKNWKEEIIVDTKKKTETHYTFTLNYP